MKRPPECLIFISKTTTAFCVRVFCNASVTVVHHHFLPALSLDDTKGSKLSPASSGGAPSVELLVSTAEFGRIEIALECCDKLPGGRKKKDLSQTHCSFDF